jgi:hypothetical protein
MKLLHACPKQIFQRHLTGQASAAPPRTFLSHSVFVLYMFYFPTRWLSSHPRTEKFSNPRRTQMRRLRITRLSSTLLAVSHRVFYIPAMIENRAPLLPYALCMAIFAMNSTAFAQNASHPSQTTTQPPKNALPGVVGGYRIVKPAAEPDELPGAQGGQFKIGNTDVRIGGDITVDVGAGNISPPRR